MRQNIRRNAAAKTATFPLMEMAMFVILLFIAAIASLPAHAMTRSADFYSRSNDMGHGFRLSGAVNTEDAARDHLEHVATNSSYIVSGTLTGPAAFAPHNGVNLFMTAGAGVAVEDRSYLDSTSARTDVAPSFHVGMGLKYNF